MGYTSLTVEGYTFTFNPGDIDSIEEQIGSNKETTEIASSGPAGNYNYDYDGSVKAVLIKGKITQAESTRISGYTITTILAQKQWLESVINGSQSIITLTDDYAGQSVLSKTGATPPYLAGFTTTKCMNGRISFRRVQGNPNAVFFDMTLDVGGGI